MPVFVWICFCNCRYWDRYVILQSLAEYYYGRDRLCSTCRAQDWLRQVQPAKDHRAEAPVEISYDDFWITSRYCRLCIFLFACLCRSPEYAVICRIRNPRWICKVVPTYFADFMTYVLTTAFQHNVIRRLTVLLVPQGTQALLDGLYQLLQMMADNDMTPSRTLLRGRPVDSSRVNFGLLNGWINASNLMARSELPCARI